MQQQKLFTYDLCPQSAQMW